MDESPLAGVCGLDAVRDTALALRFDPRLVSELVDTADGLFAGRIWSYLPIDLGYHDLAHTAQASRCYLDLVAGFLRTESSALLSREFHLGLAAVLFHDTGFLKSRGDEQGSGAKYTHCHVLRSCALAASILPALGFPRAEVDDILGMIRCTGLSGRPEKSTFGSDLARTVACMVATADYIGQMAAPDYLEKLPALFTEFEEADNYSRVPPARRMFSSAAQLVSRTPDFWHGFVKPRLENDFSGVYRYLALPHPARRNAYLDAIERNVARAMAAKP